MIAWTSVLASTLSMRAFSTLRILPRIGRIAWIRGSRPWRAEPPAESPSTMKTSHSSGLVDWQSDELAGQAAAAEQALAAAGQVARLAGGDPGADAAACALRTMSLPSAGFFSSQAPSWSLTTRCTKPLASVLPSLVLVWPSNCGSPSLIEMIAVRPSRTSSPETRSSRFLIRPHSSPQLLTRRGERGAEALLVGAALVGVDGVGEGVHRLGEGGVPLHRDLEAHVVLDAVGRLGLEGDDRRVGRCPCGG